MLCFLERGVYFVGDDYVTSPLKVNDLHARSYDGGSSTEKKNENKANWVLKKTWFVSVYRGEKLPQFCGHS